MWEVGCSPTHLWCADKRDTSTASFGSLVSAPSTHLKPPTILQTMRPFACRIILVVTFVLCLEQWQPVQAFPNVLAQRPTTPHKIHGSDNQRRRTAARITTTTTRRQQQEHSVSIVLQSHSVPQNEENDDSSSMSKSNDNKSRLTMMRRRLAQIWQYIQQKQQYTVVGLLYLFHLTVLTQHEVLFPVQLIPNDKGHFTGIGWDSLAGVITLAIYRVLRQRRQQRPLPSITSNPTPNQTPWNLPLDNPWHRVTSFVTAMVLFQVYFATGRFSIFWEDLLYDLSGLGFFITAPMQRSLCVLLGHLSWLLLGALLLRWLPRPPRFFQAANHVIHNRYDDNKNNDVGTDQTNAVNASGDNDDNKKSSKQQQQQQQRPHVWFRSSRKSKWLWWVIGGYCVSSMLFNVADLVNQYILPEAVLEEAQESVVSQLVNPEHNDWIASLVGYIAPCITAPWWEEVLYRGFCLPGLTQLFGYKWAVFLQGIIFSAHHMSLSAALPLAVLGWTWAVLYTKSQNLWVVVAVHALWNSRVFLGSWLGL